MNSRTRKSIKYFLFLNVVLAFLIQGCRPASDNTRPNSNLSSNALDIPLYSCNNLTFEWYGRTLSQANKIGAGVSGTVYNLKSDGQIVNDLVEKIIIKPDYDAVREAAREEFHLSQELPGLVTKTTLRGYFKIQKSNSDFVYAASLIKEKVDGATLRSLIGRGEINSSTISTYKEPFKRFVDKLLDKVIALNKKNILLWDLHGENIMFDVKKGEWKLVDAKIGPFQREINEITAAANFYTSTNKFHSVVEIVDLLESSKGIRDEKFSKEYLDIYLSAAVEYFDDLSENSSGL